MSSLHCPARLYLARREGDFDNARYWFRRSGTLPVFDALHSRAAEYSADMGKQLSWDPYLFTGLLTGRFDAFLQQGRAGP